MNKQNKQRNKRRKEIKEILKLLEKTIKAYQEELAELDAGADPRRGIRPTEARKGRSAAKTQRIRGERCGDAAENTGRRAEQCQRARNANTAR